MVAQAAIQRHTAFGYAKAAEVLGAPVQQIRPTTATLPLQQPAHATPLAFFDQDAEFGMQRPWSRRTGGGAEGFVSIDTTDVLPGDILVGVDVYFVSRAEPIAPPQVQLTDEVFDVLVEQTGRSPGVGPQRGPTNNSRTAIATGWPGSMRAGGRSETDPTKLPTDARAPSWTILLPAIPGVLIARQTLLRPADGRILTVSACNLSQFGYEIIAVEADV